MSKSGPGFQLRPLFLMWRRVGRAHSSITSRRKLAAMHWRCCAGDQRSAATKWRRKWKRNANCYEFWQRIWKYSMDTAYLDWPPRQYITLDIFYENKPKTRWRTLCFIRNYWKTCLGHKMRHCEIWVSRRSISRVSPNKPTPGRTGVFAARPGWPYYSEP